MGQIPAGSQLFRERKQDREEWEGSVSWLYTWAACTDRAPWLRMLWRDGLEWKEEG